MRPIFTVHAGEYLVASKLEECFPEHRVWLPSKDIGVDLLITDACGEKVASLQVKFSKDHLASGKEKKATADIKAGGWWKFDREKIKKSPADFWVLVLCEFNIRNYDYVIISPKELAARYEAIAPDSTSIQSYFWVTRDGKCWETRGLGKAELSKIWKATTRPNPEIFRNI